MMDTATAAALAAALQRAKALDAPVDERLAVYTEALRQHLTQYSDAVDHLIARLQGVAAGANAPRVGEPMPPFILPDDQGGIVTLEEALSDGVAVIAFHRGHWCPYCRINAHSLGEIETRVRERGGQIVAITPERQRFAQQQRSEAGAAFRVLSDIENGYALSLNLAIWIDDEVRKHLLGFGRDLAAYHGNQSWILPIPATFVVGREGVIVARYVNPDHRRRMDVDEILAAIDAAR